MRVTGFGNTLCTSNDRRSLISAHSKLMTVYSKEQSSFFEVTFQNSHLLVFWNFNRKSSKTWQECKCPNIRFFSHTIVFQRHFVFMSCIPLYYARPVLNMIRCQFEGEKKLEKMRIVIIVALEPSVQQFKMPCEVGHEINSPCCCPFAFAQTCHRKWLQVNHLKQPSVNRRKRKLLAHFRPIPKCATKWKPMHQNWATFVITNLLPLIIRNCIFAQFFGRKLTKTSFKMTDFLKFQFSTIF